MKTFIRLFHSSKRPQDNWFGGELFEQGNMWDFTGQIRYRKTETSLVLTDFEVKITEWEWREHITFWGVNWYGEWTIIQKTKWINAMDFKFTFDDEMTYQTCTK